MGVYDDLSKLDNQSPTRKVSNNLKDGTQKIIRKKETPVSQSIDQPINQPVDQSTNQLTEVDTLGPIVDRPRAFYITQSVDRWLDEAVRHLRDTGMHKMDRSVLVNSLLHNPNLFKPISLQKIRKHLLAHLTNKSLKRMQSTG